MKNNLLVKVMCIAILITAIMPVILDNDVFANTQATSDYWNLTTDNNTSSSGGRKLNIETYVNGVKVSDSKANTTLKYENSYRFLFWTIDGVDPGKVAVSQSSAYIIDRLNLSGANISNGSYISLEDNETKTLKIYLLPNQVDSSYTINYYANSVLMNGKTETINVTNYTPGSTINVTYKSASELGLDSVYDLVGNANITKILDVNNPGNNVVNVYYSVKSNYTINYYANNVLMNSKSETKQVTDYSPGSSINVDYKTASALGLSSSYKLQGDVNKTLVLNLNDSSKNVINIYYGITTTYDILYYANTVYIGKETKQVDNFVNGASIPVDYKSNVELNLTSDYKIKGNENLTIVPASDGNSKIKVFYSNATIAAEDAWKRTKENSSHVLNIGSDFYNWNWTKANSISLDETVQNRVWDGAYNNIRYFTTYSNSNLGFEYATWKQQFSNKKDMRRFQTVITIPEGYDGNDFVRMKSVNQDSYVDINNGNIVPINDNIFVFVYPESQKNNINDSNYLNYLAFWSGTVSQGSTVAYYPNNGSNKIKGNKAIQISKSNDRYNYNFLIQTDGWYVEATVDNIGEKLVGAKSGNRYVVDIFTQDYAEGGGMDKYVFEFVKNKAPRAMDDVYIAAKNGALNVSNLNDKKGILDNDEIYVPEAGARAELNIDGTVLVQKSSGVYSVYDSNKVLGGTLTNFNSDDGTFTFTPSSNYVGVLEFNYSCYQKKAGQDVVDSNLKDVGKISIYVLPKVTVDHKEASLSNNQITGISTYKLGDDQVIYGWPSELTWNPNWIWPENEAGINRPSSQKSSYTASSDVFQNYSYIGYRNESGSNVADSTNSSKTLTGTFSSSNKTVGFYYEKGKSNLIVECYVEGTSTLLKKESFTKYKGDPYTVSIPSISGYSYISSSDSLSGYMPSSGGGLTIKLYYKINTYNYKVEYYFNNVKEYDAIYSKSYNSVVNSYLDAKDIDDLKDMVTTEGYIFNKVENLPLTVGSNESLNVIKVYYVKTSSDLIGFYMYPNSGVVNTIDPKNIENENRIYNEYDIVSNFKYTFGFEITAGTNKPDVDVQLSGPLTTAVNDFKLYDKDGNLISNPEVNYNSYQALKGEYNLVPKEKYTITFGMTYGGSSSDLNMEIIGDINVENTVNKIKLYIFGRPNLE